MPAVHTLDQLMPCIHPEWKFYIGNETWAAPLEDIPPEIKQRRCVLCGEFWQRKPNGAWYQRHWTAEEIARAL